MEEASLILINFKLEKDILKVPIIVNVNKQKLAILEAK